MSSSLLLPFPPSLYSQENKGTTATIISFSVEISCMESVARGEKKSCTIRWPKWCPDVIQYRIAKSNNTNRPEHSQLFVVNIVKSSILCPYECKQLCKRLTLVCDGILAYIVQCSCAWTVIQFVTACAKRALSLWTRTYLAFRVFPNPAKALR